MEPRTRLDTLPDDIIHILFLLVPFTDLHSVNKALNYVNNRRGIAALRHCILTKEIIGETCFEGEISKPGLHMSFSLDANGPDVLVIVGKTKYNKYLRWFLTHSKLDMNRFNLVLDAKQLPTEAAVEPFGTDEVEEPFDFNGISNHGIRCLEITIAEEVMNYHSWFGIMLKFLETNDDIDQVDIKCMCSSKGNS